VKLVKPVVDPIWKIYAGIAAEQEQEVRRYKRPPMRFRASETSQCRRRIWFRLGGFLPTPSEPWLRLVAESGTMHHEYVRYLYNAFGVGLTGFTEDAEGKQKEDKYIVRTFEYDGLKFDVSAQADAGVEIEVVEDGETKTVVAAVVEIKSMSQYKYQELNNAYKKGAEVVLEKLQNDYQGYVWQGNTTAMVKGLEYVYLVVVGRSGMELGLANVPMANRSKWDPLRGDRSGGALWKVEDVDRENILAKLADIARLLEAGDKPAADYTDGSDECKQCAFWYLCHGAKKGGKYPIEGLQ